MISSVPATPTKLARQSEQQASAPNTPKKVATLTSKGSIWDIPEARYSSRRLIRLTNLPLQTTESALKSFLVDDMQIGVDDLFMESSLSTDRMMAARLLLPLDADVDAARASIDGTVFLERPIMTSLAKSEGLVFIGNLADSVTPQKLYELASSSGPVYKVFVMVDDDAKLGHSHGYGFAEFPTREQAIKARADLASRVVDGRPIRVDLMKPVENDVANFRSRTLFVDKLPRNVTSADLNKLFAEAGTVDYCNIMTSNGASRGFGFVDMQSYHGAIHARHLLNGLEIGSMPIRVSFGHPQKTGVEIVHGKNEVAKAKAMVTSYQRAHGMSPSPTRVRSRSRRQMAQGFPPMMAQRSAPNLFASMQPQQPDYQSQSPQHAFQAPPSPQKTMMPAPHSPRQPRSSALHRVQAQAPLMRRSSAPMLNLQQQPQPQRQHHQQHHHQSATPPPPLMHTRSAHNLHLGALQHQHQHHQQQQLQQAPPMLQPNHFLAQHQRSYSEAQLDQSSLMMAAAQFHHDRQHQQHVRQTRSASPPTLQQQWGQAASTSSPMMSTNVSRPLCFADGAGQHHRRSGSVSPPMPMLERAASMDTLFMASSTSTSSNSNPWAMSQTSSESCTSMPSDFELNPHAPSWQPRASSVDALTDQFSSMPTTSSSVPLQPVTRSAPPPLLSSSSSPCLFGSNTSMSSWNDTWNQPQTQSQQQSGPTSSCGPSSLSKGCGPVSPQRKVLGQLQHPTDLDLDPSTIWGAPTSTSSPFSLESHEDSMAHLATSMCNSLF
eukprot:m.190612 g.190612  ORF g.190612 m.190612 type:complete len:774 (-) comp14824_c0_seq2:393-2714(-)